MTIDRGGHQQTWLRRWAVVVVVAALVGVAWYYQHQAQDRLNNTDAALASVKAEAAAFKQQAECQQRILVETLSSLHPRSNFSQAQAHVTLQLNTAQATYLMTVADPTATDAQKLDAFHTYQAALQASIQAIHSQVHVLQVNPYPSVKTLIVCSLDTPR